MTPICKQLSVIEVRDAVTGDGSEEKSPEVELSGKPDCLTPEYAIAYIFICADPVLEYESVCEPAFGAYRYQKSTSSATLDFAPQYVHSTPSKVTVASETPEAESTPTNRNLLSFVPTLNEND
jgi:hypothetical protein